MGCHHSRAYLSCWIVALLLVVLPACALAGEPPSGPGGLSVAIEPGLERTAVGARISIASVDRFTTSSIVRTVTLKNESREPIVIERIQPSCGCTATVLSGADGGGSTVTIKAGGTAALQVTLDVTHQPAGPLTKFLWIFCKGNPTAALTIQIDARIEPLVTFTPALLNFGRCPSGAPRSLPLLLALDGRLTTTGVPFELVSSAPGIKITPRAVAASDAGAVVRAYTVTVGADADLGLLSGSLSLMSRTTPGLSGAAKEAQDRIAALLTSTAAALNGEVVGAVSASPSAVIFGVVKAGQPAPRHITLTGSSTGALKDLKLQPITNWISARLLPSEIKGQPALRILEVALTGSAPMGSLATQVILLTSDGKRLVLPVRAVVEPGSLH